MPPIARIGDFNSGHGDYGPVPLIMGSNNVLINGRPASRVGDQFAVHCSWSGCHQDVMSSGSGSVFVNGRPIARIGDSCGAASVVDGSKNVFAGG